MCIVTRGGDIHTAIHSSFFQAAGALELCPPPLLKSCKACCLRLALLGPQQTHSSPATFTSNPYCLVYRAGEEEESKALSSTDDGELPAIGELGAGASLDPALPCTSEIASQFMLELSFTAPSHRESALRSLRQGGSSTSWALKQRASSKDKKVAARTRRATGAMTTSGTASRRDLKRSVGLCTRNTSLKAGSTMYSAIVGKKEKSGELSLS